MKAMFITTHDFGELSLATFLARNQEFEKIFIIPEQKAAYFDEVVNILYTYTNVTQLERIIDKETPNIIFLNTAYLFVNGNLATMESFKAFFSYLQQLKCPIVTSDPFARVYDSFPECSFKVNGQQLDKLKSEMSFLNNYLSELPHIYGFSCKNEFQNTYSFYNKKYCKTQKIEDTEIVEKDNWLFVLGELDFNLLLGRHEKNFVTNLVARLQEISKNPNNVIRCVFPLRLVMILRDFLPPTDNIHILNFTSLRNFESLISISDVVFYWNVFSNSILMCYYYDVPFLCFEKGHIADLSPDLFKHMSEGIYRNGTPEFVDFFTTVENKLDTLLENYYSRENRQKILKEYQQLPSPETIVKQLVND